MRKRRSESGGLWGSGVAEIHTDAEVGVDRGIASGAGEVLVFTVGDVEVGLGVAIFLGQAKIDDVNLIAALADAHEKVVRFDVAVDEGLRVDVFNAADELVGQQQDGLEGELAVAEVEQILERGAEKVKDHGVVVTLGPEPPHEGNADTSGERLVDASFIFELGVLGLDALEFDGDLLARDDVSA